MSVTLCEECFNGWADEVTWTVTPILPCIKCGRRNEYGKNGLKCHVFMRNPIKQESDNNYFGDDSDKGDDFNERMNRRK